MRKLLVLLAVVLPLSGRDPLETRIAHQDPSKYHHSPSVHAGAGSLDYEAFFGSDSFNTNLFFLHRGVILPKSGIGHHFHNQCEEMFVIFDGEAQFTIDGRTSLLKGPAGALCRMGHSHAIYNATDKPVEWMNINISSVKGKYDAFNLDDARENVPIDPTPVFMAMHLDRSLLKPAANNYGGRGTSLYRRALPPEAFTTNWSYVDHVVVPEGGSLGKKRHQGLEEFYYVMNGDGTVHVNSESAPIHKGDAIPILLNEVHSFDNTGHSELEFMIVGIARTKYALDTEQVK